MAIQSTVLPQVNNTIANSPVVSDTGAKALVGKNATERDALAKEFEGTLKKGLEDAAIKEGQENGIPVSALPQAVIPQSPLVAPQAAQAGRRRLPDDAVSSPRLGCVEGGIGIAEELRVDLSVVGLGGHAA